MKESATRQSPARIFFVLAEDRLIDVAATIGEQYPFVGRGFIERLLAGDSGKDCAGRPKWSAITELCIWIADRAIIHLLKDNPRYLLFVHGSTPSLSGVDGIANIAATDHTFVDILTHGSSGDVAMVAIFGNNQCLLGALISLQNMSHDDFIISRRLLTQRCAKMSDDVLKML